MPVVLIKFLKGQLIRGQKAILAPKINFKGTRFTGALHCSTCTGGETISIGAHKENSLVECCMSVVPLFFVVVFGLGFDGTQIQVEF